MKSRHFIAIVSFLAAFGLSVFLVGLLSYKIRPSQAPCEKKQTVVNSETELQTRIRKFLEADFQTGIELANDKTRLSQSHSRLAAESKATFNLFKKMDEIKCNGLPADFCNAWDEHKHAWLLMTDFLYKDFKNEKLNRVELEKYRLLNDQIGNTYQNMLAVARNYGVDFKY